MKTRSGGGGIDGSKPDRKAVERNRRIHMRGLCFKLSSLIPPHHLHRSKEMLSQQDQIDMATTYISQLKERIEGLKMMKELIAGDGGGHSGEGSRDGHAVDGGGAFQSDPNPLLPVIDLREWESGLELTLIIGESRNFGLHEVLSILEEEGAEVMSASISRVGDKVIHSIHAQERISRVGVETTRICERLRDLLYSF
ncbi:hypothetical protein MLD38_027931 [Melastoma candidum]|uniref:Uncharacterized protein n=1 Tax=Melastoma candidum TaxID=119954 RepID=A0ACB9N5J7_9MYRT|nr:hypothetical protein MLD38_027931 [Melastoma candidum]